MPLLSRQVLLVFIGSVCILIALFVGVTVLRRIVNARRYRALDLLRDGFRRRLARDLASGGLVERAGEYCAAPGSLAWRALEDVLLETMNDGRRRLTGAGLLRTLGYVSYYEQRLKRRGAITRASAADKLGRMLSAGSVPKLAPLLALDNPEIVSVAMRSLGRIGTDDALEAVLHNLPHIEERVLVSRKTVQAALEQFSHASPDVFVRHGKANAASPRVVAAILGALSALPKSAVAVAFAAENLASDHPEVRAKALKLLGSVGGLSRRLAADGELAVPLLRDPVWFVRAQAARALQNLGDSRAARCVGALLFDGNWQVRTAAAAALTALGPDALNVFLEALRHNDRYARESVCEEIERSRFTDRLFEHLGRADADLATKAHAVLVTMHDLGFSTPLHDYAEHGSDEGVCKTVKRILAREAPP